VLFRALALSGDERSLLLRVNAHTALEHLHQLGPMRDPGAAAWALLNLGLIEVLKRPLPEAPDGEIVTGESSNPGRFQV
jgi:hypothetical protein